MNNDRSVKRCNSNGLNSNLTSGECECPNFRYFEFQLLIMFKHQSMENVLILCYLIVKGQRTIILDSRLHFQLVYFKKLCNLANEIF